MEITPFRSVSTSSADSASSITLVKAPCCHASSSRESLSALEDVSTVMFPAATADG